MTIHHDKLAYGKIASASEELTEDKIAEMLKLLNSVEEVTAEEEETADAKNGYLRRAKDGKNE